MSKIFDICLFVSLFVCLLSLDNAPEAIAGLAVPSGQFIFQYAQEPSPILSSEASEAKPLAVGPVIPGKDSLAIRIAFEETGPVDIFLALSAPGLVSELFLSTPQGLQPISAAGLVPWKKSFIGSLDETVLSGFFLSALPQTIYTLILVMTPPDSLNSFHIWMTNFGSSTSSVGHLGGMVTDRGGASAFFPEGALSKETTVSIFTHSDPATLPAPAGGPNFPVFGGASFGPDGLTFNSPVTITIPLSSPLPYGKVVPLFMYDSERGGWRMTEFRGTVGPDGKSVSAKITHFTDYIIMARDKENVDMFFGEFTKKFFDICNSVPIPSLFEAYISGFSAAFPIGGKSIFDFTAHFLQRKYACYEIVGVDYILAASRMIPDSPEGSWKVVEEQALNRETGIKGPIALVYLYDEVREISDSKCGEYQLSFQWDVTVYLRCSQPDFTLSPSSARINARESVPIRVKLTCDGKGMDGQTITFSADGRGRVREGTVPTDADGAAETRLYGTSGSSCSDGQAQLTASYNSCPGQGDTSMDRSTVADVIFSLSDRWSMIEVADETDCLEGVNTYKLTASVSHHGHSISMSLPGGRAYGTKSGCSIVGLSVEREDSGKTKGNGSLSIAHDGQSMSGNVKWTWVGDEIPFICSGSSTITMERQR